MRQLKTQDQKMKDQLPRWENVGGKKVGLENAGQNCRAGMCLWNLVSESELSQFLPLFGYGISAIAIVINLVQLVNLAYLSPVYRSHQASIFIYNNFTALHSSVFS